MLLARFLCFSRRTVSFSGIAGALLTLQAFPNEAKACDCAFAEHVAPSEDDKVVPTNTKIWTNAFGCRDAVLQKQGGIPIPVNRTQFGDVVVFEPMMELEIGSTYELTNCTALMAPTPFTVTEGPDTTPPPLPLFTMGETHSSGGLFSSCGEEFYVPLEAKYEGAVLVLDVANKSTLNPQALSGEPVDAFFAGDTPLVGYEICGANNWNFDEDGDAVNTRLGVFDLAGNFSGMTPAQTVEAGCTCSTVGTSTTKGYGPVFAALVLVGLSRMRKKTRR